jgi:hypothetical protein
MMVHQLKAGGRCPYHEHGVKRLPVHLGPLGLDPLDGLLPIAHGLDVVVAQAAEELEGHLLIDEVVLGQEQAQPRRQGRGAERIGPVERSRDGRLARQARSVVEIRRGKRRHRADVAGERSDGVDSSAIPSRCYRARGYESRRWRFWSSERRSRCRRR